MVWDTLTLYDKLCRVQGCGPDPIDLKYSLPGSLLVLIIFYGKILMKMPNGTASAAVGTAQTLVNLLLLFISGKYK